MSVEEINKMLEDKTLSDKLRASLEKRKQILLNDKVVEK